MDEVVKCRLCGKQVRKSEAEFNNWTLDQDGWECDSVKIFDHRVNAYKRYPRCLAKKIRKGTTETKVHLIGAKV